MANFKTLKCPHCDQNHIEIDYSTLTPEQIAGKSPVLNNFLCNKIARRYRVLSFCFDLRANSLSEKNLHQDFLQPMLNSFRAQWGTHDFNNKLKRYMDLHLVYMGLPIEYYHLLEQIVATYVCAHYYPAQTSTGALGERILNLLLLETREYFKHSGHYKKIYKQKSFDNWDTPIEVLTDWKIITTETSELFIKLKKFRNDSIHYNKKYNFEENSKEAIKILAQIIDAQFNYLRRNDLFWNFNVPGEIWLRSSSEQDPFVKKFVIPNCAFLTPYCEPTATPPVIHKTGPLSSITDEDFLNLRKNIKKP